MDMSLIVELWNQSGIVARAIAVLLVLHPLASGVIAVIEPPKEVEKFYTKFYNRVLEPLALHVGKAKGRGGDE